VLEYKPELPSETEEDFSNPSETQEDFSIPSETNCIPSETKEAIPGFFYEPYGL
jgi:hypothetical protein